MADENELDRLAGLRPDALGRWCVNETGEECDGAQAYTELARLRSAADPERDARREAYRDRQRRRAVRALDRYISIVFEPGNAKDLEPEFTVAGERFVEAVGDYVISRVGQCAHDCGYTDCPEHGTSNLQQKSHYGATEHECWIKDDACLIKGHPEPCRHPNHPYFPDDCMFPNNVVSNETPHNADSVATYGPDES